VKSLEVAKRLAGGWSARVVIALLVAIMLAMGTSPAGTAAPASPAGSGVLRAQNVGWLSAESVAEFASVEFTVLVPTAVPGPFGGEPAIDASGGAYSLYWMIPGGAPTFLHMEGIAGGALPAGSPNDLNIPLEINASVGGNAAIHDVTDIYDNVWWQAGGVLYSISSRNSSTDSLGLANALIPLVVPDEEGPDDGPEPPGEGPVVDPEPEEPVEQPVQEEPVDEEPVDEELIEEPATALDASLLLPEVVGSGETTTVAADGIESASLVAEDGVFPETGTATYDGMRSWDVFWQAPTVSVDTTVSFTLIEPIEGTVLASGQLIVVASQPASETTEETTEEAVTEPAVEASTEESVAAEPEDAEPSAPVVTEEGSTEVAGDVPTDGTDGPTPPVFGSDGTGGIKQVSVANVTDEVP